MKIYRKKGFVAIWVIDWIEEENDLIGPYDEARCENGFVRYLHANAHGKTFGDAAKEVAAFFGVSTGSTFLLYDYCCDQEARALTTEECARKGVTGEFGKAFFLGNFEIKRKK